MASTLAAVRRSAARASYSHAVWGVAYADGPVDMSEGSSAMTHDAHEDEFDRAWARTLEADADLLHRLTGELLAAGKIAFTRGGRTLTASISPTGGWLDIEVDNAPYIRASVIGPGLDDEYRSSEVFGQLALGLMNL